MPLQQGPGPRPNWTPTPPLITAGQVFGPLGSFVTNANAPQVANYALVAGIGFFIASAVAPQGQVNAAQYTFGLHAQAIHQAEGAKTSVWKSVPTPPAAAPQSAPLRLVFTSQEPLDLSISSWVIGGTQANQGPVPAPIITLPQDPTQPAAQIWKSQPAVVVAIPSQLATFFSTPPQSEERSTRAIWQSLQAGQAPPTGAVPPITRGVPQTDPSQLAPQIWKSVATPPAVLGVTVWPTLVAPPQFDTSINPTIVWTPSTFSPGLTPPIPPAPDVVTDVIRNFSLLEWRKWHRPEDERELRKLRITPAVAEVIAQVAERQAQALDLDEQQRLEELTRELELKKLKFQGRYLELLNTQRQLLIDQEIATLMQQKQAALQRMEEEAILLFLMTL